MEISKIQLEANALIEFLKDRDMKADEKIAALKTAAACIEYVIAGEFHTEMLKSIVKKNL